ncbi:hypothetical protein X975_08390, partial [Stegodyphus mimosarum]
MRNDEPKLSKTLGTSPKPAYLEAVEFRTFADPEKSHPIICAACLVKETIAVKPFYAHASCPKNWKKEYSGLMMADSASNVDTNFLCLNKEAFTNSNAENSEGNNVAKLNPVWMSCHNCNGEKIVPCVVCSYENKAELFSPTQD